MIFPDVDYIEWAKQHNLQITPDYCRNCGKEVIPTIPYAEGEYRGLKSESHGCPPGYDHYIFHTSHKRLKDCVKRLARSFSQLQKEQK